MAAETGMGLDADMRVQLGKLSGPMLGRLARWGLVAVPDQMSLGRFLDEFFKALDVKPGTVTTYKQTQNCLIGYFGAECLLTGISPMHAERWRQHMKASGLSTATIARRIKMARQMFRKAIQWDMIVKNPFDDMRSGSQANPDRMFEVTREITDKIIEQCPNAEWRLLITLARYGGLRVPSEAFALRWGDVDWAEGRIRVTSQKTEHYTGKGSRIIPLWPELLPHLQEVFTQAAPGTEYVISSYRNPAQNLRTRLTRIIRRCGLEPWPRLWQNMRSSRKTELAKEWPIHVVCAWIGNTPAVAVGHYLKVSDSDYKRAIRGEKSAAKALHQDGVGERLQVGEAHTGHITPLKSGMVSPDDPSGIRTRVAGVKSRCPGPLDDGAALNARRPFSVTIDISISLPPTGSNRSYRTEVLVPPLGEGPRGLKPRSFLTRRIRATFFCRRLFFRSPKDRAG